MSDAGGVTEVEDKKEPNKTYVGKDSDLGLQRQFRQHNRWTLLLVASLATPLVYQAIWGSATEMGTKTRVVLFGIGVVASASMVRESRKLTSAHGWPRWQGLHYALLSWFPVANLVPGILYLFQRTAVLNTGTPALCPNNLLTITKQPRATLSSVLRVCGISLSLLAVVYLVLIPVPILRTVNYDLGMAWGYVALSVLPVGLWLRQFTTLAGTAVFDITMRDLTIRLAAILGLAAWVALAVVMLFLPLAVFSLVLNAIFNMTVATTVTFAVLYSLLILPLSAVLVLILRSLPWIQALPHVLKNTIQSVRALLMERLPLTREQPGSSELGLSLLPYSGHPHTQVDVAQKTDVSMPGHYGYFPQSVTNIQTTFDNKNIRKGVRWAFPGLAWFTAVYVWRRLNPDAAEYWLAIFPGENILIASLSFIGLPRIIVTELLAVIGLSESMLSLGFVGGIIPAVLLIPTAWHFVLAYEAWLYRILNELGGQNRLLFLWTIHLLPLSPLVAVVLRIRDGLQARRTN